MRPALAALLLCGACTFTADYGGTGYLCAEGMACPTGQTCVEGRCVIGTPPTADAAVPPPMPDAATPTADAMPPQPLDPPWWNDAWSARRQITITNTSSASVVTDMPVGFEQDIDLWLGGAPYSSLRVMHWNSGTQAWAQMRRVIDGSAVDVHEFVWIDMWETLDTGDSVDHYWVYYGNPDPTGAEPVDNDPYSLFDYYNPFVATDPTIEFTGSATVAGGDLQLAPGASVRTLTQWGTGYAVDFELRVPTWGQRIWGGFQRSSDFTDDQPWALWITRNPNTGEIWPEFLAAEAGMTTSVPYEGPLHPADGTERRYTVERFADRIVYRYEHANVDEFMLPGPFTQTTQVRLANQSVNTVYFDMVRVRPAVYPAPTVTIGPEVLRP